MEVHLDIIWHVRDETGPNRMTLLAELSALGGEARGNSPSARGWSVIQKSLSIMEDLLRTGSRVAALAFWNEDEEREQLDIIKGR